MRNGLARGVSAAALALACASAGFAQEAPVRMPPLTVTGTAPAGTLTAPSVEDAREQINRRPGGVELVPSEEFRDSRAATVKDVLGYVPGVYAQPKWGEDSRLSIRGSGLSRNFHLRGIRLMQDGVPLNTADGGGDFQEFDPLTIRYAEVYKGANALEFGATMLGGVVNFVTPTGRDWTPLQARGELGSYGFRRFQLSSGQTLGAFDYFVTPTFSHSDGYRSHETFDNRRLNANVGYQIDPSLETRFYLAYNHIDQEVSASLSKTDALRNPRSNPYVNIFNDYHRDIESVRVSNKTSFLLDDIQYTAGVFYLHKDLYHPIFQVVDNAFDDGGAFLRAVGERTLFGAKDRFTFGGSAHGGRNRDRRFVNVRSSRGALTFDTDEYASNVELFGENQYFVTPAVALVTGAQASFANRVGDDHFLRDGDQSSDRSYTNFNPKLGVLWELDRQAQLFANVSRSSEVPTFSELNPTAGTTVAPLKAQKAITAEVGSRGRSGGIAWDVSLYRSWIHDELQNFALPSGQTFTLNADKTIHQGIELGLDAVIVEKLIATAEAAPDRLRLRQAYTYSDFHFDGDPAFRDNELPGAPRHYYRGELVYEHPLGFSVGPNVEWVPEAYFVDNANTLKTSAYVVWGARARWQLENGLTLFADARNLTDRRYISNVSTIPVATPANSAVFFPGEGRGVYAGVEYRW